jgi:NADH-quinone oxidoreductase subunit N
MFLHYLNEIFIFSIFLITFCYYNHANSNGISFTRKQIIFNNHSISNSIFFFSIIFLSLLFIYLDFYINPVFISNYSFYYKYSYNIFILFIKFFLIFFFLIYFMYLIIEQYLYSIQFSEYCFIFFFYILFSFLFITITDLLLFFILLEFQSICFYALIAIERNSIYSTESGLRYWILNSITSLFLLFTIVNFYVEFGILDLLNLNKCFYSIFHDFYLYNLYFSKLFLNILLLFISFFFKIGAFPFHIWNIDVYEFISSKITLFFLIFPKFLLFTIFLKLFYNCFDNFISFFSKFLSFSFLFSVVFSVVFAIYQDKIKKILIFNSLFSTGFQLLFISLSILESIQGFFFYIFFYLLTLITFFFLKLSLFEFNTVQVSFNFNILNKLYYSNFFLAALIVILIFNSLGIPPFANFFCKIFIFYSCIITNDYTDFLFLLFFSMISSFYHLRFLKSLFFDLCLGKIFFISHLPWIIAYSLSFFTFILTFIFFDIMPLFFFFNVIIFFFLK